MGTPIVKLTEGERSWYLIWSSISDSPSTYGMSLAELHDYVRDEFGASGLRDLPERLERVERYGTSCLPATTAEELISFNRAGPGETTFTIAQIISHFCKANVA